MPSCIHVLLVILSIISIVRSLIYYPIIVALLEVLVFSKFAQPALHFIWLQPFCSRQILAAGGANPISQLQELVSVFTSASLKFHLQVNSMQISLSLHPHVSLMCTQELKNLSCPEP